MVSDKFHWRFQSFVFKGKNGSTRQVSPKLGAPSIKGSFGALVNERPEISGESAKARKIQNYSFGQDSAQHTSAEMASIKKDMASLLIQAGFEEIKDALDEEPAG